MHCFFSFGLDVWEANWFGVQADWEELNRKSKGGMFQALNDAGDGGDGDAMVDDSGAPAPATTDAPAKPAAKPVFANQNPVVADHVDNDEDEEIT